MTLYIFHSRVDTCIAATALSQKDIFKPKVKDYATDKLSEFGRLENGWHYGEGVKFNSKILLLASQFVSFLKERGFEVIDAFPGLDGEIRITTYPFRYYFEITIESLESINLVVESAKDVEIFRNEQLSFEQLKTKILQLRDYISWSILSESYQRIIGSEKNIDLTAWPSETAPKVLEGGSPWLVNNVQSSYQEAVAVI